MTLIPKVLLNSSLNSSLKAAISRARAVAEDRRLRHVVADLRHLPPEVRRNLRDLKKSKTLRYLSEGIALSIALSIASFSFSQVKEERLKLLGSVEHLSRSSLRRVSMWWWTRAPWMRSSVQELMNFSQKSLKILTFLLTFLFTFLLTF